PKIPNPDCMSCITKLWKGYILGAAYPNVQSRTEFAILATCPLDDRTAEDDSTPYPVLSATEACSLDSRLVARKAIQWLNLPKAYAMHIAPYAVPTCWFT
ncbi:MAG: hypothetical protein Q9168_006013, partial [Polycauliona sp. 1 TL-2023]